MSHPMTDEELEDIGKWIDWAIAPGKVTVSGTPPKPAGWGRIMSEAVVPRLMNEIIYLRRELKALREGVEEREGGEYV